MIPTNTQNVPRSDKTIKRAFIPKLDAFMFLDYKAIEVRVLAYYLALSIDDSTLAEEINNNLDPHLETAKGLFPGQAITDEMRNIGKTCNFSIIYGAGVPRLMEAFHLSYEEARQLLNTYHEHRPGIRILQKKVKKTLTERGYIRTLWGRRLRPIEDHKALNALIQGCSADLIRHSAHTVHHGLKPYRSHIVNLIHDEIMIDATTDELEFLATQVPEWMKDDTIQELVTIGVDCEVSYSTWADKEDYV